jgi:hypothetical protein
MGLFERLILCSQGLCRIDLLISHRDRLTSDMAQPVGVAVRKVSRDFHPFPTFGPDGVCLALELLGDKPIEQHRVLQPTAIVLLEKIPQDGAAGRVISRNANKLCALIRGAHRPFGQESTNRVWLLGMGASQRFPDLIPTLMVRIHGECHELVQ